MEEKATIEITEDDYFNIMGWWSASVMMAESGLRSSIKDSERDTISKISEAKRKIDLLKEEK